MRLHHSLQLVCLALAATCIHGYSSGAPGCSDLTPGHGGSTQAVATSPYTVTFTPANYTPGGSPITVTIASTGASKFRGFLLTTESASNRQRAGTFATDSTGFSKPLCDSTAMTHNNNNDKTSLQFQWTPPATSKGNILFKSTFVQTKPTYWVGVPAASMLMDASPQSGNTPAPTAAPALTGRVTRDAECGSTKGCYTKCSGSECDFTISWAAGTSNDTVRITISGLVGAAQDRYLALGLSKDNEMSDDSVMYCVKDGVYNAYNADGTKSSSTLQGADAQAGLTEPQANLNNGVLTCSFLRNKAGGSNGQRFALDQAYTLFFATGSGAPSYIGKHNEIPLISSEAASLQDFTVNLGGSADFPLLVKAHGSLMVVAWIFAASIGIVFARYFRNVWEDKEWFGAKIWFQIHRSCMVIALLATIIAFIIIFVEVGGYSHVHGQGIKEAHPIIGIIVTILTVINPTIALFRPDPKAKNRPIFNWVHWGIGTITYILGVLCIFFGMEMDKAGAPDYIIYILAAFVGWQFLIQILLELAQCMGQGSGRSDMYQMSDVSGDVSKPPQTVESNFHKQLLITLHVLVVSGFAIAVIIVLNIGSDE